MFGVSLSRESLTLIYISILYINYRSRRNQVNKDRNGTLDLWSYASVERLVFRNTEKGLNAIKAIYNYNKYNLIHTHRSLSTSPLPTLLYPRTRNNPIPCYLLYIPRHHHIPCGMRRLILNEFTGKSFGKFHKQNSILRKFLNQINTCSSCTENKRLIPVK